MRRREVAPAATGNLPKALQANLCFPSAFVGQTIRGVRSPRNTKEVRSCHGQLRHSLKCASASRSTAISRPSFEPHPRSGDCLFVHTNGLTGRGLSRSRFRIVVRRIVPAICWLTLQSGLNGQPISGLRKRLCHACDVNILLANSEASAHGT